MIAKVKGTYIDLDKLLKLCNLVASGGHAKIVIQNGEVLLNGKIETRRRKKIFSGDIIEFAGEEITVSTE